MIVLELVLLLCAVTALLTVVGLGPVLLFAPDLNGLELLLAPLVGLAVLYWASQWLSPHFASGPVIIGTCLVFGAGSCVCVWRRWRSLRAGLRAARVDLGIVAGIGLLTAVLVELPLLRDGIFTLADFSGDELFTWAPTAAYMQTHAYAAPHATAYVSPLLWLLPTNIYPGSAGTVDGGLLSVFGLHAYQFEEPFTALALALGGAMVYAILRWGLRAPRAIALIGLLLVSTNQFRFVTAGFGFAQAARGTTLMMVALLMLIVALTQGRTWLGVLAGGVMGVLVGVYMPAFLIALTAVAGAGVVLLIVALRKGVSCIPWRAALGIAAGGLAFGLQNLVWLLFNGGLHAWVLQTDYGSSPLFAKYPFENLMGAAPDQFLYTRLGIQPFTAVKSLFWNGSWNDVAVAVAALTALLVVTGVIHLMARRRWIPAACLGLPLVYGAAVYVDNQGGFGSLASVMYLVPVGCVLAAAGVWALAGRVASLPRRAPGPARSDRTGRWAPALVALSGVVALVLVFQAGATAEDENFYVRQSGMLSSANLALKSIASVIPPGASVLMYATDGSTPTSTVAKTQALVAAGGFLPGRDLTIDGLYFSGMFGPSDHTEIETALASQYTYILHDADPTIGDPRVPTNYHVVWRFRPDHLVLYERDGTQALP